PAQGVEALDPGGGRAGQLPAVPRRAVVVEDDLSVQVFEARHAGGDPTGGWSEGEELGGRIDGVAQGVNVGFVVVDVQRGPGGGRRAEDLHEGLGAVVAGPHADPVLVEHLGEVVGVDVAELERQ